MKKLVRFFLPGMIFFLTLVITPFQIYSQQKVSIPLNEKETQYAKIHQILGADSNLKIKIFLENLSKEKILFEVPAGIVFKPAANFVQRMATIHDQQFEIPAAEKVIFEVDALCLDAWKQPPSFATGDELSLANTAGNDTLRQFIQNLEKVEQAIIKSIYGFFGAKIRFRTTASDELIELAQYCQFLVDENSKLHAQIDEQIIQCALWQIMNEISLKDYLKILKPGNEKEKEELKKVAELAQILLCFADLQPTITIRKLSPLKL